MKHWKFTSLNEDDRKVYNTVKRKLQYAFKPEDIKFTSLSEFHERTIYPGETPQKYMYELKRLLKRAFPEMAEEAREQLLFEQYIHGLPKFVYENIRTSPDVRTTDQAMKRAQIIIRMHSESVHQNSEGVATVIDKLHVEEKNSGKSENSLSQIAIDELLK